jgi:nitroreductase
MDVQTAIRQRRSIRAYQDRPVEPETLERVLDAGRRAPSARNLQEWRFVVVQDAATRARLAEAACGQAFVGQAPVVIAACAVECEHVMTCGQHCYPIDVAIALDHMSLQAVEEGLGTCWIGAFHEDQVKAILGIPDAVRVVELMPLGYPAAVPAPRPRKPLDEVVARERWK